MARRTQLWYHMALQDSRLFASFVLSEAWDELQAVEFDVHVGTGRDFGPAYPPRVRVAAFWNTQKRIDVVGWIGGAPILYEVKPLARLSAFGQIEAYQLLYEELTGICPQKALITDDLDPDTVYLAHKRAIKIAIVDEATDSQIEEAQAKSASKVIKSGSRKGISLPDLLSHPRLTDRMSESEILSIVRDLTGSQYSNLNEFLAQYCIQCRLEERVIA